MRGVLCNWLVCSAVWMAAAATSLPGKMLAAYLPVMAFIGLGLEHSVANMWVGNGPARQSRTWSGQRFQGCGRLHGTTPREASGSQAGRIRATRCTDGIQLCTGPYDALLLYGMLNFSRPLHLPLVSG